MLTTSLCTKSFADFRSDTATLPTAAMHEAMRGAPLGDDALGEDPTCVELEAEAAAMCGQESGIFVPSGTFANILAMGVHLGPLSEVVCDARCHILRWENGGSVGGFTGASARTLDPDDGARFISAAQFARNIQRGHAAYHVPPTALLSLENTLNGAVQQPSELRACAQVARDAGVCMHLDGARLWNACTALGCTPAEVAAPFDTVSVCLSKALGAPDTYYPRRYRRCPGHHRKLLCTWHPQDHHFRAAFCADCESLEAPTATRF